MSTIFSVRQWRILAILWTLGIVGACSIPGQSLPRSDFFQLDKLIHAVMFAGFGGLWLLAQRSAPRLRAWRVLFAGLAFAVLTEVYQGFLPFERFPDPYDALANALGLGAALLVYAWRRRRSSSAA